MCHMYTVCVLVCLPGPVPLLPKPPTATSQGSGGQGQTYALIPIQNGVPVIPQQPLMVSSWQLGSPQLVVQDQGLIQHHGLSTPQKGKDLLWFWILFFFITAISCRSVFHTGFIFLKGYHFVLKEIIEIFLRRNWNFFSFRKYSHGMSIVQVSRATQ